MIPDLDIYRAANVIIKQYGQDAPIHAVRHPPGGAFFVCALPALRLVGAWFCEVGSSEGSRATFCHN